MVRVLVPLNCGLEMKLKIVVEASINETLAFHD
jgi:hypothetical protein